MKQEGHDRTKAKQPARRGAKAFQDNVVVVSGASSGIGKEMALQLAEQGAILSLAARSIEGLERAAAQCRKSGAEVLCVQTDVAQEGQCENLIARTVERYGRIDTLINNAGLGLRGNFSDYENLSLLRIVMDTNFFGMAYPTFYALPHLKKTKGRIVAMSSIIGKIAIPGESSYCAGKFAVAGFFDSLRMELADCGVSVTVVYPGYVVTEFSERSLKANGEPHGSQGRRLYTRNMMSAEECAGRIIKAAAKRKRDVFAGLKEKIALWVNLAFPRLSDRLVSRHIRSKDKRLDSDSGGDM